MAKKTVKELVTKWGFQIDKKPLMQMQVQVAKLKGELKALSAIAVANALAIFGLAEHTSEAANEVRLAAIRTGISAEAYQKLGYAAKLSGVDTETFAHSMMFLNRNMHAAKMGSKEAASAFVQLGGGVAQAIKNGATGDKVFTLIGDRLGKMKDRSKAGALAMHVFGRAGAMLLPMFKGGAKGIEEAGKKAEELGLIFDEDGIKSAHEFHEAFEELKGSLMGFKNSVGISLLQPVTLIIRTMSDWMRQNRALIKSQLLEFFKGLKQSLSIALIVLKRVGEVVVSVSKVFGGLGSALKLVITLFTAMKVLQFVSALGTLAQMLYGLTIAWKGLTAAEILADLWAAAIPIAIGVAIVAVIALIEDLMGMFQGKNSLVGVIIDAFAIKFPNATRVFKNSLQEIVKILEYIGTMGGMWDWLDKHLPKSPGAQQAGSNGLFNGAGNIPQPIGPQLPASNPYDLNSNSSSVSMGDINVNVTQSNASPQEIGDAVHEAVFKKGLDKVLRPASRALAPGRKY